MSYLLLILTNIMQVLVDISRYFLLSTDMNYKFAHITNALEYDKQDTLADIKFSLIRYFSLFFIDFLEIFPLGCGGG
jgi:hypothetical protein